MPPPSVARLRLPWREPLEVLAPVAETPFAFALLSDGSSDARWSYVGHGPSRTFATLAELRTALEPRDESGQAAGPPFQGGAVGLAAFELAAVAEPTAPQARCEPLWLDLAGGVYPALVAFDHHAREVWALARDETAEGALAQARGLAAAAAAAPRLDRAAPLPSAIEACAWDRDYPAAVAEVVAAIEAGEIFQANIARGWTGRLPAGATPFDLLHVLHARSPAPFAGYLRLPGGRALVSRSPERFLSVSADGVARTSPIKGTRPRSADPTEDARLAAELLASDKDRAENLMIVDVMRNDLARACTPGTVKVEQFCALQSFSNVHHLVSTVSGRLASWENALSLFASALPPASVSGAPKLQALQVIARHEPPRGPYCGSMFRAGLDGSFDSSVLIRSLALDHDGEGWRWEARAGAGITADSDPQAENAEAVAKARAVLAGFVA